MPLVGGSCFSICESEVIILSQSIAQVCLSVKDGLQAIGASVVISMQRCGMQQAAACD
jgi:hypothetical protein